MLYEVTLHVSEAPECNSALLTLCYHITFILKELAASSPNLPGTCPEYPQPEL